MSVEFKESDYVAIHENPIWKKYSNFIIRILISDIDSDDEWEQLWVKKINNNQFMVCCIPFFAYGLALGDSVIIDEKYHVKSIVEKSGNTTMRLWFGDADYRESRSTMIAYLGQHEIIYEWSSKNLLAVSASCSDHSNNITDFVSRNQFMRNVMIEFAN